jgi:hypothetical protein
MDSHFVDRAVGREGTSLQQLMREKGIAEITDSLPIPVPQQQVRGSGRHRRQRRIDVVYEDGEHGVDAGQSTDPRELSHPPSSAAQERRLNAGDLVEERLE